MPKSFWHRAALLAALLMMVLALREWHLSADGKLHIHFLDVGQGDGTLIVLPHGDRILIDGGPDWAVLEGIGKNLPFLDRRIDTLILSHPHLDHIVSLPEVLRRYKVKQVITDGGVHGLGSHRELLELAKAAGVTVIGTHAGQTLDMGDGAIFDVLWPPKNPAKIFTDDPNNISLVLKLTYKNHTALFTGDAEEPVEKTLVAARANLKSDILKAGHHGSKTSSSTGFVLAVAPALTVISAGEGNSFKHPSVGIPERLMHFGSEVRRTDLEGQIDVTW